MSSFNFSRVSVTNFSRMSVTKWIVSIVQVVWFSISKLFLGKYRVVEASVSMISGLTVALFRVISLEFFQISMFRDFGDLQRLSITLTNFSDITTFVKDDYNYLEIDGFSLFLGPRFA